MVPSFDPLKMAEQSGAIATHVTASSLHQWHHVTSPSVGAKH